MSEQEQLIKVLLEDLQELKTNISTELHGIKLNMATKQELLEIKLNMATKQELHEIKSNMATKQELQEVKSNMATKQELQEVKSNMATKQELQEINSNMATKQDTELINLKLEKLSGKIDAQHIENINADNRLLNSSTKGKRFIRKITTAGLENQSN